MDFSGACGYVSGSEPLLLMPGYPEVPSYKVSARLPLITRLPGYAKRPGCPVRSARLLPGYYRLAS